MQNIIDNLPYELIEFLKSNSINNGKIESQRFKKEWFFNHGHLDVWEKYKNIFLNHPTLSKILGIIFDLKPQKCYSFTGMCNVCGSETPFVSIGRGFKKHCSNECKTNHKKINYKNKTGYDHQMHNPDVIKKLTETNFEKYGVAYTFQSDVVREKSIQTIKEKYGDEYINVFQVPSIIEKRSASMFNSYGCLYTMESPELSKKALDTKHQKDENGLDSYERRSETQKNDIDENGLNFYDRIVKRLREDVDENGLNFYDRNLIKSRKTNIANKFWIADEDLPDFKHYCRKVNAVTKLQPIESLINFHLRGNANVPGAYHLDHRYSKFEGFRNNIPPYIIGHICNLEMIMARNNLSKNRKCSITQEELFELFF